MHPPYSALTVLLLGLAGLLLLAAGWAWSKLAKDRERVDERPAIPVAAFRQAAAVTAAALILLGAALCWLALVMLSPG
jgi:uncharacterized membrane protein YidH (DUF202 family)